LRVWSRRSARAETSTSLGGPNDAFISLPDYHSHVRKGCSMKKSISVLLMGAALAFAGGAWACDGAGQNNHVGEVTKIDKTAGTFTIHDVQTNAPIAFKASKEILDHAAKAKGQVMVGYEKSGDALMVCLPALFSRPRFLFFLPVWFR